ncbi:bifunctional hydroxymethylpyrimidine kinase/phosphomethylpyrimidine kinase [Nakamurella sp.]|uniref:bifunctional hydroxymethylpyrimidine kinase/phosphomethylpyrimidine kinase n=1 Tax=Nakamurella sp. TaxID=1869182 RepID=UPI003B3B1520
MHVLSIAGSDPSGGAGIQADLKTFAAHGAYGMAAIASLTAQNTTGVRGVFSPPASFLAEQLAAIADDIDVDAVKIGMLGSAENIAVVRDWLTAHRPPFVVLDPVMVATSGDRLLDADAESALRDLLACADLLTPNVAELAVLVGDAPARDLDGAIAQGKALASTSGAQVLVKGGHLGSSDAGPGREATDALVGPDGSVTLVPGPWVETKNTHGTGCTLSSALAALRPQRESWAAAAIDAKAWLTGALAAADTVGVGRGRGPVDHLHALFPAPFSQTVWQRIAPIRTAIETMPFITALADGTLPWADFRFYLAQDAWYLREYARCLARVAALAPDQDAQEFFAHSSAAALEAEMVLHRTLLTAHGETLDGVVSDAAASPVTTAYLDHLHHCCATGSYAQAASAVLPCFWLYQYIGERLGERRASAPAGGEHPYAAWIETYADPAFAEATTRAVALADRAYATASPAERAAMIDAFERSSRYEWMFFDQGTARPAWPV